MTGTPTRLPPALIHPLYRLTGERVDVWVLTHHPASRERWGGFDDLDPQELAEVRGTPACKSEIAMCYITLSRSTSRNWNNDSWPPFSLSALDHLYNERDGLLRPTAGSIAGRNA